MEIGEKLRELRKQHDMTQEQLAEKLFVSRTAVSKWETGRGVPNIDSLKAVAALFGVSMDELLSGEELASLAQKENRGNLRHMTALACGALDAAGIVSLILPLYGKPVQGYIYSVTLFSYDGPMAAAYVTAHLLPAAWGILELLAASLHRERLSRYALLAGLALHILVTLFLIAAAQPYAATLYFVLLLVKGFLLIRQSGLTK